LAPFGEDDVVVARSSFPLGKNLSHSSEDDALAPVLVGVPARVQALLLHHLHQGLEDAVHALGVAGRALLVDGVPLVLDLQQERSEVYERVEVAPGVDKDEEGKAYGKGALSAIKAFHARESPILMSKQLLEG